MEQSCSILNSILKCNENYDITSNINMASLKNSTPTRKPNHAMEWDKEQEACATIG